MKQNFTVRQGALDGIEAFLSVAQHRSFRRAAAQLGVTPSAISQAVRTLETRIGAALFIRTTRSVGLTEAGERFLSRAKPAFEELVAASEVARDLGQRPAGLLRITVPRPGRHAAAGAATRLLPPRPIPRSSWRSPRAQELVDIAAEGFDAGIRLGEFIAPDMVVVRLTPPFPFVVVGSPDYLRARKQPERIDDLRDTPACACAARTGRLRLGPLSTATRRVEAIVAGPLIAHDVPDTSRSSDPRFGTCAGARPARQSADRRRPIASAADVLCRHDAGGFPLLPGQTSGLAQAARLHRAREIPERRRAARREKSAEIT